MTYLSRRTSTLEAESWQLTSGTASSSSWHRWRECSSYSGARTSTTNRHTSPASGWVQASASSRLWPTSTSSTSSPQDGWFRSLGSSPSSCWWSAQSSTTTTEPRVAESESTTLQSTPRFHLSKRALPSLFLFSLFFPNHRSVCLLMELLIRDIATRYYACPVTAPWE